MMKNHMANVHNSDAKSFVCERCGKSFPSSVAFKVELVSKELNHFGVITGLFRQIGGEKWQF